MQSVTPRRTSRKISRKKMAPKTPYTTAEVMEMLTELRPPMSSSAAADHSNTEIIRAVSEPSRSFTVSGEGPY